MKSVVLHGKINRAGFWMAAMSAAFACSAEILLPDPSIAVVGKRYYLLGTEYAPAGDPALKPSGKAVFPLYVSDDLHAWRLAETAAGEGRCLSLADAFGKRLFWAPQLFSRNGKWFLAYTCDFRWGIAVADRPEGPFRPWMSYVSKRGQAIDPFVFQDEDGRAYVYFSSAELSGMAVAPLSPDLRSLAGSPMKCITNDQPWERKPLEPQYEALNRKFGYGEWDQYRCGIGTTEGPTVMKRRGKYVLFYSANDFRSPDYCVGAAVADNPLGPWKKLQSGAVLSREHTGLNGTGHGDVFFGPDGNLWYVFHAHNSGIRVSPRRTGVIQLVETVGADGYPRYAANPQSMRLL